jgi:RNA polymerase sigma-70 factor (ECF subfamily)
VDASLGTRSDAAGPATKRDLELQRFSWAGMEMFAGCEDAAVDEEGAGSPGSAALSRSEWLSTHILPLERRLRRYLRKRIHASWDVDDVIQDIYLRLSQTPSVAHVKSAECYLWQTASSIVHNRYRRQKFAHDQFDPDVHMDFLVDDATPAREMESREQLRLALTMLDDLPAVARDILILRRVDGLSISEIACQVGLSISSVDKYQQRAHRYLVAQFEMMDELQLALAP